MASASETTSRTRMRPPHFRQRVMSSAKTRARSFAHAHGASPRVRGVVAASWRPAPTWRTRDYFTIEGRPTVVVVLNDRPPRGTRRTPADAAAPTRPRRSRGSAAGRRRPASGMRARRPPLHPPPVAADHKSVNSLPPLPAARTGVARGWATPPARGIPAPAPSPPAWSRHGSSLV